MKYKYLLIVLLLFIFNQNVTAQCTTCNITVTVPSSANITTIADGQTICFKGSGSYTGTLEFGLKNNHTICIGDSVIFNPSAIQNPGGGSPGTKFYNNGNWITSLSLGSNVDLVNYGVITTNSFNLTGGNIINNYGVITTTNAGEYVNINTGSSFISHAGSLTTFAGFLSLGSGGDFKVGGIVNVKKDLTNNSGATIPGIPPACAGLNVTGSFLNNGTVGSDGSNPAFGGIIANKTQTSGSGNFFGSTNVINPTITSNPTNQTTCPAKNAIFSVSATGPNLSYQWQRKTPTGYINVVNGGFYSGATTNQLQVTGANSTMDNLEFRVMVMACPFPIYSNYARLIVKPLPGATISPTNVTICNGNNNGAISISTPTGGSGFFEYSIDGGSTWFPTGTFSNLIAKTYNVQIRDANANQCSTILNPALTLTEPAKLNANILSTDVTVCNGNNNGTITVQNPTGGSGNYQYSKNGGTTWSNSGTFTSLVAGSYAIQMRDASNTTCFIAPPGSPVSIGEPVALNGSAAGVNITTCKGSASGQINISNPSGGSGVFEFTKDNGVTWQSATNFPNLTAGTYNVQMRDKNNTTCIKILDPLLKITEPNILSANIVKTPVTLCFGNSNGAIELQNPTGGSGSYDYTIDGGLNWNTSPVFSNLFAAPNYNVRIRDAVNTSCFIILDGALKLSEPTKLSATVAPTNVTGCFGNSNGSININGTPGGSGSYNFSKDGGTTWQGSGLTHSYTGMVAGTYDVRIRDAASTSCIVQISNNVNITKPTVLNGSAAGVAVTTCNGNNNGIINITSASGGSNNYQYSKDGGTTYTGSGNSFSFTGLLAGNYNVLMRDANNPGCIKLLNNNLNVGEPVKLNATIVPVDVTGCFGNTNGSIDLQNPTGGSGTYEFTKDGNTWGNTSNFTGLGFGIYDLKIRDKANPSCVVTLNASQGIGQPIKLAGTATGNSNTTCNGSATGSILIDGTSGGSGSFNFTINGGTTWTSSLTTNTYTNLAAGNYNVQIRDNANQACVLILDPILKLTEPGLLNGPTTITMVTGCNGGNNGSIKIGIATGGSGTYNYSIDGGTNWFGSTNSYTFTNLTAATYNLEMRDAANITCRKILNSNLVITEPVAISATITSTNVTTCSGNTNGSIIFKDPLGGSGNYNFSIDNGSTWSATAATVTFSSLGAGNYKLKIRDAATPACIVLLNNAYIISEPTLISASIQKTNVTGCFQNLNGSIEINSAMGGSGNYNFSIDGGANWTASLNTTTYTNVGAGTYNVQIRDHLNPTCIITLNAALKVTEPAVLKADVSSTPISGCAAGINDGTITFSNPSGGISPFSYNYSIDNGATWSASTFRNNLPPDVYNVQIQDANNVACTKILNATYVLSQTATLDADVDSVIVTQCAGRSNGVINITNASGSGVGSTNYQFSKDGGATWQGSGTSHPFINLKAGTYNLQLRDAAASTCVKILRTGLILKEPDTLKANVASKSDTTCFGSSLGIIDITGATGGDNPLYEYSVINNVWDVDGNFNLLPAGTYTVKLRDQNNPTCEVTLRNTLVLTEPKKLEAQISATNVTGCAGNSNGAIDITSEKGGSGYYEYTIKGATAFSAIKNYTNLKKGTFDVQIRDKYNPGCLLSLNNALQITQPDTLNISATDTDVTGCFGNTNGTITMGNASGGSGNYQYSIDGGINYSTVKSYTNLAAGNYTVMLKDASNISCTFTYNPTLIITEPVQLFAVIDHTDVGQCNGNSNGRIDIINAVGGSGKYQYSKDGGVVWNGTGITTHSYTGLKAGNYNVLIRDSSNKTCKRILDANVVLSEPIILSANVDTNSVTGCFGSSNGSIDITGANGGSNNFEYSKDGGSNFEGTGNSYSFTGLTAGTYNIVIQDKNNPPCRITLNASLLLIQPVKITASLTPTNITGCKGNSNGSIAIDNVKGGSGNYQFTKDGGADLWAANGTSFTFTGLNAKSYDVRVRDASNTSCEVILNSAQVLTDPIALSGTAVGTDVTLCKGNSNGKIVINSSAGGSGTYEYSNDGGTTYGGSNNFTNLTAGLYTIMMRDANAPTCSITLLPSTTIGEPSMLNATLDSNNVTSCFGNAEGDIVISSPSGGSGVYEYSILPSPSFVTNGTFTGLSAGSYVVVMRDKNNVNCTRTLNGNLVLKQPSILNATLDIKDETACYGNSTGSIEVQNQVGGSGQYEYNFNGNGYNATFLYNSLGNGIYTMSMRDKNNPTCTKLLSNSIEIKQPGELKAVVSYSGIGGCTGNTNGSITISSPTGGSGSYNYSIDNGATYPGSGSTYNFNNLPADTYDVRIQDALNPACNIMLTPPVVIEPVVPLTANLTSTHVTGCFGNSNGTISISGATGGSGFYQYSKNGTSWEGSGKSHLFSSLGIGSYNIQIRDASTPTCVFTLNGAVVIDQPKVLNGDIQAKMVSGCKGNNNGEIDIVNPSGGSLTYEYSIDGGNKWEALGTFSSIIAGSYDVRIRDKATPTCLVVLSSPFNVTEPGILKADVKYSDVTICNGNANGEIVIDNPKGGSGFYEYSIDSFANYYSGTSHTFPNLKTDTFYVQIRDMNEPSCIISLDTTILIEPKKLSAKLDSTMVTDCNGSNTGSISISAALGGSGTHLYSINSGAFTGTGNQHTFSNLIAGDYNVRIMDASNPTCIVTLKSLLKITQPGLLGATVTPTQVSGCFGNKNGRISISNPSGGSGNYEFAIDGIFSSTRDYDNLPAKIYVVKVTDAANPTCIITLNTGLIITEPQILSATVTPFDVTQCFGNSNGRLEITNANGGSNTFQFSLDSTTWNSSGIFSGLKSQSNYKAYIKDAANPTCVIKLGSNIIVNEPKKLTADSVIKHVSNCYGENTGSIAITNAKGGSEAFEYTIDGGNNWSTLSIYSNLSANTYNLQMRDLNNQNCILLVNNNLDLIQPGLLGGTMNAKNITVCKGSKNGEIKITNATGGSNQYEYSINGGSSWNGTGLFPNLGASTNNVQIRDLINPTCIITLDGAVVLGEPTLLTADASGFDVKECNGNSNGEIKILNSSGGSGTYEYTIDNANNWRVSPNFSNLSAGTYNVKIRDRVNKTCIQDLNTSLNVSQPVVLDAGVTKTDVSSCYGSTNGAFIIVNASGGSGTFEYTIDGGNNWGANKAFNNIKAGVYDLRIRDFNSPNCTFTIDGAAEVTQPQEIKAIVTSKNVSGCIGNNDGLIKVSNATGGNGTFNFSKDGGANWVGSGTNFNFTGLLVGDYDVQIRDAVSNSCIIELNKSLSITNPDSFTPPVITTQPTAQGPICAGSAQPVFSVTANGTALTFQWMENGIKIIDGPVYSGSKTASLMIKNPTSSYNGKSYQVVITGTCGTVSSSTPAPLLTVIEKSAGGKLNGSTAVCENNQSGNLNLTAQNGTILHWESTTDTTTASWNVINNNTSSYDPGVLQNTTFFRVVVKNGNCPQAASAIAVKTIDTKPSASVAGSDQSICGSTTSIQANIPTTGKGTWININGSGNIFADSTSASTSVNGIEGNTYTLVWKIKNGVCNSETDTVLITLKPIVVATVSPDIMIKLGTSAQLVASGGTSYSWKPSSSLNNDTIYNPLATPTKSTTYVVIVGNNYRCFDTVSVSVAIEGVVIPNTFSPNDDGTHDNWVIQNIANYPQASILIFNRWGQTVGDLQGGNNLKLGWDGRYNGSELPIGTYFYVLKLDETSAVENGSITILK